MTAFDRLLREMKASPPKAGVLIVLTVIGTYFWIPPIWNAIAGDDEFVATDQSDASDPAVSRSAESRSAESIADSKPPQALHWQELELVRSSDPLFQSASPPEVKADAFGVARKSSSAAAEDHQQPIEPDSQEQAALVAFHEQEQKQADLLATSEVTRQLSLRSTMIGSSRRAAVINDRVYSEGDVLVVAEHRVRIRSIEPRRVTVEVNDEIVELRIDPFASSRIRLER